MDGQPPAPAGLNPHHLPPTSCDRHPGEPVVGFCASCLRERLSGLEPIDAPRKSTSSTIKTIFFRSSVAGGAPPPPSNIFRQPELRRCKSFSSSRAAARAAATVEPQRKSCDVRARNTLWALFHQDNRNRETAINFPKIDFFDLGQEERAEIVSATNEEMEEEKEGVLAETKPMKEHIDLDSQAKKVAHKDIKEKAGSFWLAASVFSKKLGTWRRNQKLKKKPLSEMQVGVEAFGRRSCDIDRRFCMDSGRFSLDEPRSSWDVPRASWDGCLIGGARQVPASARLPPILPVVEDAAVPRFDGEIPVEEDFYGPGGKLQTRDYYDGRRRSLDRANSTRKQSFESGELFPPFHGIKHERDSRELCSESFESGLRDLRPKVPPLKKTKRWSRGWSIWGLIHRNAKNRANVVERSFSERWPEMPENGRLFRSNSIATSRSSAAVNGGCGGVRRNELGNHGGRMKKDEILLERNSSSRIRGFDNGLLRFYLPPIKDGRRGRASGRSRYNNPHSFSGSMLSLY